MNISNVTGETCTRVLYVDLDGTVRHGADERGGKFVNGPGDVVVFPEALAQLRQFKQFGWRIIAVSNQGGIALGLVSFDDVAAAMAKTHELCGQVFDKIGWCQHHPDAKDPEMARCWCRKPRPGLAIECALNLARKTGEIYPPHMALFVGDRPEDRACADAMNVTFLDAKEWRAGAFWDWEPPPLKEPRR